MVNSAVKILEYQSIAQRLVGQLEQGLLINAPIVGRKLSHSGALIKNTAITNVVIKAISGVNSPPNTQRKSVMHSRVEFQRMLGNLVHSIQCGIQREQIDGKDLLDGIQIGVLQSSKGINILVRYVEIKGQAVKNSTLTILNPLQSILSYDMRSRMAEFYVRRAIELLRPMLARSYCDVIRKRYAKFIGKGEKL